MTKISELSSATSTGLVASTSEMVVNVGSTTMRALVHQVIAGIFSTQGEMPVAESSVATTVVGRPAAGRSAVLLFSSITEMPVWTYSCAGTVLRISSNGSINFVGPGDTGQVLAIVAGSTAADWVDSTSIGSGSS